jgi:hypothetical protein
MTEVTAKVAVSLAEGSIAIEGSETFVKEQMAVYSDLIKDRLATVPMVPFAKANKGTGGQPSNPSNTNLDVMTMTTSAIATKISVSSGPELVIAAVARLMIVLNGVHATRKDILKEMQTATAYYKDSYSGNLGAALKTLVTGGKLNDLGGDKYSFHVNTRTELEKQIAQ